MRKSKFASEKESQRKGKKENLQALIPFRWLWIAYELEPYQFSPRNAFHNSPPTMNDFATSLAVKYEARVYACLKNIDLYVTYTVV